MTNEQDKRIMLKKFLLEIINFTLILGLFSGIFWGLLNGWKYNFGSLIGVTLDLLRKFIDINIAFAGLFVFFLFILILLLRSKTNKFKHIFS